MIRLFLAVELPDILRLEITAVQAALGVSGADVKWVEAENLHLTLKFLGAVERTRMPEMAEVLQPAVGQCEQFTFALRGIGAFPDLKRPRVVWIGIEEGREQLARLVGVVDGACRRLGFPAEDRPFTPHLTIGRIRSPQRLRLAEAAPLAPARRLAALSARLDGMAFACSAEVPVERVVLFHSTLSPKGPIYTEQAAFALR